MIADARAAKAALRAAALARRADAPDAEKSAFAARLALEGPRLAREAGAAIVSAFMSFRGEVDTAALIAALDAAGFRLALPAIGARDAPLSFGLWRPGEPLARGQLGIREPLASAPRVLPDLLFTPLAAFDRRGARIGFGAGYYDRTLAMLRAGRPTLAIGVAFACQEIEAAPVEPHDEPLDAIITEREVLRFARI